MDGIRIPEDWRWMRVREDIENKRLWKARDRLQGHLVEDPANQDVLDMLGAVWFEMGDLPQAGRHWWLTERDDEAVAAARGAFYERFGHEPGNVLRALPRPAKPEHYPPAVRARLEDLVGSARADGLEWGPWAWKRTDIDGASRTVLEEYSTPMRVKVAGSAFIIAVVGLLLLGAASAVSWVLDLIP